MKRAHVHMGGVFKRYSKPFKVDTIIWRRPLTKILKKGTWRACYGVCVKNPPMLIFKARPLDKGSSFRKGTRHVPGVDGSVGRWMQAARLLIESRANLVGQGSECSQKGHGALLVASKGKTVLSGQNLLAKAASVKTKKKNLNKNGRGGPGMSCCLFWGWGGGGGGGTTERRERGGGGGARSNTTTLNPFC